MKALVTGAAGFIGFHLTKSLVECGHELIGLDNLNSYYDVNLKNSRLAELGVKIGDNSNGLVESQRYANFKFIKMDIINAEDIGRLFAKHQFDIVVHMAAQAGVRYSLENPQSYIDSNCTGFVNILEGCRKNSIKSLVYASSSSVYGLNSKQPFSEMDGVNHPVSLYAATKRSNELMAHTYSHLYNLPTTGLRFFTVYGPWGRPDMALFKFTQKIINDEPIQVFNNGEMYRDFTYIDDIVDGVMRVIDNPSKPLVNWSQEEVAASPAPYKVYNIGNNKPVKLLEFIEAIENKVGKKARRELLPMQPGDVEKTYADISQLKDDLGYNPVTDVQAGIDQFVEWYVKYYNEYKAMR